MNNSTPQQTWSTAQLDQLRQFLQTASQIPSTDSMLKVLHSHHPQYQQSVPGHSQKSIEASFGNLRSAVSQSSHGVHPVPQSSSLPPSPSISVPNGITLKKYPQPDFNSMVFDLATGYRFDRTTGLYYDANAGLFINKNMNALLQWNQDTSTYKLVGRATDKTTPALAQDLARLMGHAQAAINPSVSQPSTAISPSLTVTSSVSNPPIPSSLQSPARDMLPFRRERSLSFEEMSPVHDNPGMERYSPDLSEDNAFDQTKHRRRLSFDEMDEMTPERDVDDLLSPPLKNDRADRSSRSPHSSPRRDSLFPKRSYSPDMGDSRGRDSYRRRSPDRDSRERRSPWWDHRKSPRRNDSKSPKREFRRSPKQSNSRSPRRRHSRSSSRGRRSPWRSHRKSPMWNVSKGPKRDFSRSPKRSYSRSPRRRHSRSSSRGRRSPWRDHPKRRRNVSKSPQQEFSRSPARSDSRSPSRHHSRTLSQRLPYRRPSPRRRSPSPTRPQQRSPSPNQRNRLRDEISPSRRRRLSPAGDASGGRRVSRRSQSPGRRQRNDRAEWGQHSISKGRGRSSRSRSRSRGSIIQEKKKQQKEEATKRRSSRSPLGRRKSPQDNPGSVPFEDVSPSCSKEEAAAERLKKGIDKGLHQNPRFSSKFMVENINRIHKKNLLHPKNKYGRIFPQPTLTVFIMLTPLPHKGDRQWEDLEILLKQMLEAERFAFYTVDVFPGDGGAPFNYCLIRFKSFEESFHWYMSHEGAIDLAGPDGSTCTVFMNFMPNNWKCGKCKTLNFALRRFCYKCFWYSNRSKKSPVQVSQLVTLSVGIAGLDCRFLTMEEILVGLPPLDSFNVETFELLAEPNGIPLGLCVFTFKHQQESAEFYRFLQESCLNPIFVDINDRAGLSVNPISGHFLKNKSFGGVPSRSVVKDTQEHSSDKVMGDAKALVQKTATKGAVVFKFPMPPKVNTWLWWRFVSDYVPEEGANIMKELFDGHPIVRESYESTPSVVLIGPLPIPVVCDLMEYRDTLSLALQHSGVDPGTTDRISICKSHHFGAPYNYSLLRFPNKLLTKEWVEKKEGKLTLSLEDGSSWPVYLHHSKANWQCESCHKLNFPVRIQCFVCYKPRMTDHTAVTIRKNPTHSIGITGFQNWCATEELLFAKLPFLREIQNLTVDYLNEPTGVPLGICVIKSSSPAASEILFNKLQDALTDEIARTNIQSPNRPLLVYIL